MSVNSGEPPSNPSQDTVAESLSCPVAPYKAWRPENPLASFRHAADGITETFQHERNFRFHFLAAFLVLAAGLLLHLSLLRMVAVLGSIALVLITELLNTAIEATVDMAMPAHHPLARRAKDAAAGAVLIAAFFAAVVGVLIFVPAILPYVLPFLQAVPVAVLAGAFLLLVVGAFAVARRSFVSSLRSSRKIVIGVALTAFGAACACRLWALPMAATVSGKQNAVSPLVPNRPALPSSAGVP